MKSSEDKEIEKQPLSLPVMQVQVCGVEFEFKHFGL